MFPDPRLILAGFLAGFVVVTGWLTLTARTHAVASARGAFTEPTDQANWRGLLLRAALRRADELNRLRDLPDTPVRQEEPPPATIEAPAAATEPPPAATEPAPSETKVSSLPGTAPEAVPEDMHGNPIADPPSVSVPVDIGETSTIELPVTLPAEPPLPPVYQIKPTTSAATAQKTVRKHRKRRPKSQTAANANASSASNQLPNPFLALFGGNATQFTSSTKTTTQPASPFGQAAVQPSTRPIHGPIP